MNRLLFLALFISPSLFAIPADSLNQYNAKHKKHGFWIQYLDSALNPVDSAKACFYGYEKYDNGEDIFKFRTPPCNTPGYRMEYTGNRGEPGKPVLLNGTFRWYYTTADLRAGMLGETQEYRDGRPFLWCSRQPSRSDTGDVFEQYLDFSKTLNGADGTYYYEEATYHPSITKDRIVTYSGYFRKGKKGWRVYGEKTKGTWEKYGVWTN